jgi:hypothetical protein
VHVQRAARGTPDMKLATSATVAAVAAAVFVFGVSHPKHNWDMIGYVASAHYQDGLRGERLLATTYADVQNEVDSELFTTLSESSAFRIPRRRISLAPSSPACPSSSWDSFVSR